MTTPTETDPIVHGVGPGPGATHCGLPFTADLRLSAKRSLVTCPACLTAMGEPRVISGLDAVAATPEPTNQHNPLPALCVSLECSTKQYDWTNEDRCTAPPPPARPSRVEVGPVKPTAVAVGQRWRTAGHEYMVVDGPDDYGRWATDWHDGERPSWINPWFILCDEFLGLAAPVETPPAERCGTRGATTIGGQAQCVLEWGHGQRGERHKYDVATVVEARRAVAPAPGVGKGPRNLTFPEACEALVAGHLEVQYLVGGQWLDWSIGGVTWSVLSVQGVARLSNFKWRLKPEPLPAPAPRVALHSWMVVRRIDTDPVEAYPFNDEAEAREFYDRAQLQWSEVYLCQVIKGPVA